MDQPDKGLLGNGLPKMIEDYGTKMSFSESYTWDIDQHILSHAILSSGLCSLPGDNKLWKELNIEPRLVGIHSIKGRVVNLGSVTFGKHNFSKGLTKSAILPNFKRPRMLCLGLPPHREVPKLDFQSGFSMSKIIKILLNFFIEE